jgi:hemolysin III
MGWIIAFAAKPLFAALPLVSSICLFSGGVAYTAGCIFYAIKRKWFHAVWHLFVIVGGVCHFFAVYFSMG